MNGWSGCPIVDNASGHVVGLHVGVGTYKGSPANRAVRANHFDLNRKPTGSGPTQSAAM